MGISLRKNGFWHRGFPLTTRLFLSHLPSQARWQLQLKGLDRRFLGGEKGPLWVVTLPLWERPRDPALQPWGPALRAGLAQGRGKEVWERECGLSSKTQTRALQGSFQTSANGHEPGPAVHSLSAQPSWVNCLGLLSRLSPLGPSHTEVLLRGMGPSVCLAQPSSARMTPQQIPPHSPSFSSQHPPELVMTAQCLPRRWTPSSPRGGTRSVSVSPGAA